MAADGLPAYRDLLLWGHTHSPFSVTNWTITYTRLDHHHHHQTDLLAYKSIFTMESMKVSFLPYIVK